ncbi:hypothetical protein Tco_0820442 [Tanacetum coccineum]|uniref:Uncharacterized protein n=1 Tax=Tanacetum coccineum TaxID=301880 RepID=A0ABQ5AAF1_9ASTR
MGITLSRSQGLSSPQANGYVISEVSSIIIVAAECSCSSFFAVVSISAKTEDLSRKLEVNYVKFQFRGGLLGIGYRQKVKNKAKADKTEHVNGKSMKN